MNVLVIPEDFRNDQYVLKPLIKAMLAAAGKPQARVRVCQRPLLGGISQATDPARITEIIRAYPMVDLFLLIVDRDGVETRRKRLDNLGTQKLLTIPEC